MTPDWSSLFIAQSVVRAELENHLAMGRYAEALVTAKENARLALEIGEWIENRSRADHRTI